MGNNKNRDRQTRRNFFSLLFAGKNPSGAAEKIKLLTADGKLVEVDKDVVEQFRRRQKASNKDIYDWMKNPSKDDDQTSAS